MRSNLSLTAAALLLAAPALAQDADQAPEATPQGQAPGKIPPPPPQNLPAPPGADEQLPADQPADSGQWVYTDQDGWVWMPYGDDYVYTPEGDSGQPYAYVYGPALGWCWIAAPWVWGLGPVPYFGPRGGGRFHWYHSVGWHTRGSGHFHGGYRGGTHGHAHGGKK
jgi:hypothetical protein